MKGGLLRPDAFRRMMAGSGVIWHRFHGGLYGAYTPLSGGRAETVAEMTFGQAVRAAAAAGLKGEGGKVMQKVGSAIDAMPFMEWADSQPLRVAWVAAENFIDRTRPGLSPDERTRAVAEKAEEAIYRTQNGNSSTEIGEAPLA